MLALQISRAHAHTLMQLNTRPTLFPLPLLEANSYLTPQSGTQDTHTNTHSTNTHTHPPHSSLHARAGACFPHLAPHTHTNTCTPPTHACVPVLAGVARPSATPTTTPPPPVPTHSSTPTRVRVRTGARTHVCVCHFCAPAARDSCKSTYSRVEAPNWMVS